MLALFALLCFVLAAFHIAALGPVLLVPLGLAFLAAALMFPWYPWRNRRPTAP